MTKTTEITRNRVVVDATKGNGHAPPPKAKPRFAPRPEGRVPSATNVFDRFKLRRDRIGKSDKAVKDDALALCTFDEWTDPDELASSRKGQPELGKAIEKFTQFLIHRTMARAAHALLGIEFTPSPESDEVKIWAKKAEQAFRDALCRAFCQNPVSRSFPISRFERVFARFLSGELRMGKIAPLGGKEEDPLANDGVPDGANYFCFAEAVLVFLRLRINPEFWRPLLHTFVGGAQVFAAAYWQGPREWLKYKPTPTFVEVPAAAILTLVGNMHASMDLTQLARQFGEIAAVSLRQDKGLPQPAPIAKELQ